MKTFVFCFLSCLSTIAFAQSDSVSVSSKKVTAGFYFDYGKALAAIAPDNLKLEGSAEVIFKDKWQLVGELGYWNMKPEWAIENGDYHIRGDYMRFGFGFLPQLTKDSRFGVGVRYAISNFKDKGNYSFENDIQDPIQVNFARIGETATWYEVVMYSDKNVNQWLALGFNFRLRLGLDYQEYEPVDIVSIPGYGRAQDKIVPAMNLFVKVSF